MAADGQPAGQPDLAELVYRRLEGSEAMRQAQGVLQAAAVDELRGVRPQMPEPPPENVLIHALIDEYLEYNRLNACRSLLETETGWRAGAGLGRPVVAHELGLAEGAAGRRDGAGRPVPLIYEAVQLLSCLRAARAASRRGDGAAARRTGEPASSGGPSGGGGDCQPPGDEEDEERDCGEPARGGLRRFRAEPLLSRPRAGPDNEAGARRSGDGPTQAVRAWADGGRLVTESSATARARRAYADAVARARSAAAEDMGDAQGVDLRVAARSGLQGTIADDPADAPSAASSPDRPVRLAGWGSVPASSVPGGGGSIRRAAGSSARERQGPMVSFRMDS
ncbi:hypothetical protein FNF27_02951 [Cafeteria roenbergensis]|uniref:LisH domain-containing protein n=1 Tax=Cafeteria roenbergensis TaxID=33653 RepID=A0A5A8EIF1_CAFRO|nr:hypothetical protein FNF27_02951 [Cafeteria roenbergensis]